MRRLHAHCWRPSSPVSSRVRHRSILGARRRRSFLQFFQRSSCTVVHATTTEAAEIVTGRSRDRHEWSLLSAPSPLTEIKATITKCGYKEGAIDRGKDYVESTYSIKGYGNSTDVGASGGLGNIKWTIQNALASATYV